MISRMVGPVRLQPTSERELCDWLEALARSGVVPGGVALIAGPEGLVWARAFGARALAPGREEATLDTFWDCASLTKPLVTTALVLRARARGDLALGPLAEVAESELWPGRDDLAFPLGARLGRRAAPTEDGNVFERELANARAASYGGWRAAMIRGETHDHNAHTLGGAAGNAGLFATAEGLAELLARWLREGDLLPAGALDELAVRRSVVAAGSEPRTWGWQVAESPDAPADARVSRRGVAHAGFTGTSVVLDPDRRLAWALLTNRIHPRWTARAFHADRREFHRRAAALLEAWHGVA
jgi:CubicO group peptidase (beta-lactamase class C family)